MIVGKSYSNELRRFFKIIKKYFTPRKRNTALIIRWAFCFYSNSYWKTHMHFNCKPTFFTDKWFELYFAEISQKKHGIKSIRHCVTRSDLLIPPPSTCISDFTFIYSKISTNNRCMWYEKAKLPCHTCFSVWIHAFILSWERASRSMPRPSFSLQTLIFNDVRDVYNMQNNIIHRLFHLVICCLIYAKTKGKWFMHQWPP